MFLAERSSSEILRCSSLPLLPRVMTGECSQNNNSWGISFLPLRLASFRALLRRVWISHACANGIRPRSLKWTLCLFPAVNPLNVMRAQRYSVDDDRGDVRIPYI